MHLNSFFFNICFLSHHIEQHCGGACKSHISVTLTQGTPHWFPSFSWKYFFCCNIGAGCLFYVSFWCDSVSCNGLRYSAFQPFSMGKIIPLIRGVAGFELTECLICTSLSHSSCVTEFWLNNIQIPLWMEETPLLSEKFILFFLTALTCWGAVMTAISIK